MTALVFSAIALLICFAFYRKPQAIMVVLAGAFVASVIAAQVWPRDELRAVLVGLDGIIATAMFPLWVQFHSQRARFVGGLSFLKCAFGIYYMAVPYTVWNTYAAALNAAFVAQVLVAGGFTDGIANWLADRYRRVFPRSDFGSRDVGV